MLSKPYTASIIAITALIITIGVFIYQESKPPPVTEQDLIERLDAFEESQINIQTFADLLKEGDVEKFNELRKEWNV